MKCFYHSADLDGHCSGAIVKQAFPRCEMIGINYGEAFPWEKIGFLEEVFMVDFCLQPFADMERLNRISKLTWIDHHKTSIDQAFEGYFKASGSQSLVIGEAGCELTWKFLHPFGLLPKVVYLLGRYDVWKWQGVPNSLNFQYGMREIPDTSPDNQGLWEALFENKDRVVDKICDNGMQIVQYEKTQNEKYAKSMAFDVQFDGVKGIAINKGLTNSTLFDSVYDPEKHHVMVKFAKVGQQWKVGLYSTRSDVDCSAITKARGGGGHKGAAGFQCEVLPWEEKYE